MWVVTVNSAASELRQKSKTDGRWTTSASTKSDLLPASAKTAPTWTVSSLLSTLPQSYIDVKENPKETVPFPTFMENSNAVTKNRSDEFSSQKFAFPSNARKTIAAPPVSNADLGRIYLLIMFLRHQLWLFLLVRQVKRGNLERRLLWN